MRQSLFHSLVIVGLSFVGLNTEANLLTGVDNSGGGKAVVCRNADKSIRKIEVLDLFEGSVVYGLQIKPQGQNFDESIFEVKAKLRNIYKDATYVLPMDFWLDRVQKNLHLLPEGVELTPINDAAEIALPSGCGLEQLASYKDETLILINQDLWNALDYSNKAALIAHEAIYRVQRNYGDIDSQRARKIVGHLFSDFAFTPILEGIPKDAIDCYAQKGNDVKNISFSFQRYDDPNNKNISILHFLTFRNHVPFNKLIMKSKRWPWSEAISDIYMEPLLNLESFSGLMLRRSYDSNGKFLGYFFDEIDGKYDIYCNEK